MNMKVNVMGLSFENPVLPASGPIVEGRDNLYSLNDLPLGGLVTKTISIEGAKVNKPCILGSQHMIYNTELWSEDSLETWLSFLPDLLRDKKKPLGISVGYTVEDFKVTIPKLHPYADFFEVSTHYNKATLHEIVKCLTSLTDKPVLIKLSPHVSDDMNFVETVLKNGGAGIVALNSYGPGLAVDLKRKALKLGNADGQSWISGPAIKPFALDRISRLRAAYPDMPIIGCGGGSSAQDVLEMVMVGADLVQVLSSALLQGRKHYAKIVNDMPLLMEKNDISSIAALRRNGFERRVVGKGNLPLIATAVCTGCQKCVNICPFEAYTSGKPPQVDPHKCIHCGLCESLCPVQAISEVLT